jgi:hypothetical protein
MMTILDTDGNEVEIYAKQSGDYVDTCIRATDRDTWIQAALSQKLLYRDPITETDPETGEKIIVGYHDEIHISAGANITEIGNAVLTPAVLDAEGNVTTPAVMDNRFHLNMRIAEPLLSKEDENGYPLWQKTALLWMQYGQPVQPNNHERAKAVSGVEMIDPDSISQPDRVWI